MSSVIDLIYNSCMFSAEILLIIVACILTFHINGLNSALSPVVYGDIALSINT